MKMRGLRIRSGETAHPIKLKRVKNQVHVFVVRTGGRVQFDPDPRPLGKVCGADEGDDSRRVTRPQLNAFAESEPRRQNGGDGGSSRGAQVGRKGKGREGREKRERGIR